MLAGTTDAYRKLRNTFRYLLGALSDFDRRRAGRAGGDARARALGAAPPRRARRRAARRRRRITSSTATSRLITNFANDDLSAFFFDIRKDSLYCDAPASPKRRAYRTVLDQVFQALVRWVSPILCFTAEEVWQSRYPDGRVGPSSRPGPRSSPAWRDEALGAKWQTIRAVRTRVTEAIEPLRRDKVIRSSLEAQVDLNLADPAAAAAVESVAFAEICIVSELNASGGDTDQIAVSRTDNEKCGRCWRHLPEVEGGRRACAPAARR